MKKIIGFQTEYQWKDALIDVKEPRFGWKIQSSEPFSQKKYRLVVSSKQGVVWDSGEVISNLNYGIRYEGDELASHTIYHVDLFVYDEKNVEYTFESTFETALLNKEDWKGVWLSIPSSFSGGALRFRKKHEILDKKISFARLYLCGLGYHEVYLNGKKLSNSVMNPGLTVFNKKSLYVAYNLNELQPGENVIGIELGYGWLGNRMYISQLYVEYIDGSTYEDCSLGGYGNWANGSPIIDNSIYGGEVYDARLEDKYGVKWNTKDFEPGWDNGWMYPIIVRGITDNLRLQTIEPIEVCDTYMPTELREGINGNLIVDIGQNISGWARIKVKGNRGDKITLKFGEDLDKNLLVNQLNLRSARCSDTYILKGEGIEEYAPKFTYHGFRYIEVVKDDSVSLLEIVGEHVHTSTRVIGDFNCSDKTLNILHKCALITEQNNEHSILTDCPQRDERFGWLNDLSSRIYQTMNNIDMSRFIPKFVDDIRLCQREDGAIADTAPYYVGGQPADPVCVIYLLLARFAYRYYGDKSVMKDNYDGLKKWVLFLLSKSNDYIMSYSYYGDWVYPYADIHADSIYISTVFLFWHLKEIIEIARILNKKKDVKVFEEHLVKCREKINSVYFNKETFNYSQGTQSENALAVSLGICEKEFVERIAENIHKDVVKMNYHSTCGNVGYRHMFYVLSQNGYIDDVIKILKNPEYPGWGYMVENGATTVWERWEKEMQVTMNSFDHPMFGSFDAFFYSFLGGIIVEDNAVCSNRITIKPYFPSGINSVNCSYDSYNGTIQSNWKKVEGGKIKVNIVVPPMIKCRLELNGRVVTLKCGSYEYVVEEK